MFPPKMQNSCSRAHVYKNNTSVWQALGWMLAGKSLPGFLCHPLTAVHLRVQYVIKRNHMSSERDEVKRLKQLFFVTAK